MYKSPFISVWCKQSGLILTDINADTLLSRNIDWVNPKPGSLKKPTQRFVIQKARTTIELNEVNEHTKSKVSIRNALKS